MQKKLYRGALSTIILSLLKEEGEMYGYEIVQQVKKRTKGEFSITEGALYPALHKLEGQGAISVDYRQHNNRTRKYYRLTETGAQEEAQLQAELLSFVRNMELLLHLKKA